MSPHVALGIISLLVASCDGSPAPATEPKPEPAPAVSARTSPVVPEKDEQLPVSEAVARIHRRAFEATDAEAKARPLCVITLHESVLQNGVFYPLVLFGDGVVVTWRQTPKGPEEEFSANLTPDEQSRAKKLIESIGAARALASEKFATSALVMGVSTRGNERVETLYFDNQRLPAALSQLAGMLKARLEATNR